MDCPNYINFDTEISEERYIEISDNSKDEEDDTCIEINNIIVNQPLNKQMTREKVKIVENNKLRKMGPKKMENFMKVTRKGFSNISLLTPPDKLHYQQRRNNSKGPKEKTQAKRNKIVKLCYIMQSEKNV